MAIFEFGPTQMCKSSYSGHVLSIFEKGGVQKHTLSLVNCSGLREAHAGCHQCEHLFIESVEMGKDETALTVTPSMCWMMSAMTPTMIIFSGAPAGFVYRLKSRP